MAAEFPALTVVGMHKRYPNAKNLMQQTPLDRDMFGLICCRGPSGRELVKDMAK